MRRLWLRLVSRLLLQLAHRTAATEAAVVGGCVAHITMLWVLRYGEKHMKSRACLKAAAGISTLMC